MHLAMSRSHTWVKRGTEYIDPVPMNWGTTLTLLGAIRVEGWIVLRSMFATANGVRFVAWLTTHLLPKLRRGDVLVMDNLRAHHNPPRRSGVPGPRRPRAVSAPILPGPEPDRSGMGAPEAARPQGRSANGTRAASGRTPRALPRHAVPLPSVVYPLRLSGSIQVIRGVSSLIAKAAEPQVWSWVNQVLATF